MKIVFFGTPEFAVPSLKILHESKHEIVSVVTAPDKPRGRGRSVSVTPIKEFALENNIRVFTPEDLKDRNFETDLRKLIPDLFVVVAFRVLPMNIFTLPVKGSFNLHGSLLPKYRGAAPIQWALINGERETGLTTFFLEKKVDTGNIILKEKIDIAESDNFGSLHDKMSIAGSSLVYRTVDLIDKGNLQLVHQDGSLASPAPKIKKDTCMIDWSRSAEQIHNLIRGLSPFPGAFFKLKDKSFKIYFSRVTQDLELKKGEIKQTKNKIFIGTSTSALEILEIQPEGRKRLRTEDFLRGYSLNDS